MDACLLTGEGKLDDRDDVLSCLCWELFENMLDILVKAACGILDGDVTMQLLLLLLVNALHVLAE